MTPAESEPIPGRPRLERSLWQGWRDLAKTALYYRHLGEPWHLISGELQTSPRTLRRWIRRLRELGEV